MSEKSPEEASPRLPITLQKMSQRKSAVARMRGTAIEVIVPRHWPKGHQSEVAQQLAERVQRSFDKDYYLVQREDGPFISFPKKKDLEAWINQLNQETLQVPLAGIRMGSSRYTRLAQMNIRTRVMTVSKYSLIRVPESALRYLVIHELAHLKVPNHSRPFWNEVAQYVPDYKHQRKLMSAMHRIRLYEAELIRPPQSPPTENTPIRVSSALSDIKQVLLRLLPH